VLCTRLAGIELGVSPNVAWRAVWQETCDAAAARLVRKAVRFADALPAEARGLADPFPTLINSFDAIHLATAILSRSEVGSIEIATHDVELGLAARAMGFKVLGPP
jgi:CelD/BcsL family acetyltransferase involved in cellulose biosynthesis